MKIIKEFKKFAVKGNAIDLAVAVIIGTAFGKIVTSLVNDIIMPPIGLVLGGVKFSNLSLTLKQATETTAAINWNYGLFVQNLVDFLIIAWVVFLMVKLINKLESKKEETAPAKPSKQETLLTEIRDLLKNK